MKWNAKAFFAALTAFLLTHAAAVFGAAAELPKSGLQNAATIANEKKEDIPATDVPMENIQIELQSTRQLIEDIGTALTIVDEEVTQLESRKKGPTDDDERFMGQPEGIVDTVLSTLAPLATTNKVELDSTTRRDLGPALSQLAYLITPRRTRGYYFGRFESDSDDPAEIRRAKLLIRAHLSRIPQRPTGEPPALARNAQADQLTQLLGYFTYYRGDDIPMGRLQELSRWLTAAGQTIRSDLITRATEVTDYNQKVALAEANQAFERVNLLKQSLTDALQSATKRRAALTAAEIEGRQKNQETITKNLLTLLIGMMAVVVIMVAVLARISDTPLATTIVEQRTLVELAGVTFLLSVVLLLASAAKIEAATTGTLLGTIAGYILSRRANPLGSQMLPNNPAPVASVAPVAPVVPVAPVTPMAPVAPTLIPDQAGIPKWDAVRKTITLPSIPKNAEILVAFARMKAGGPVISIGTSKAAEINCDTSKLSPNSAYEVWVVPMNGAQIGPASPTIEAQL